MKLLCVVFVALLLGLAMCSGQQQQQAFPSVQAAIEQIPQLSLLKDHLSSTGWAPEQLQDPGFTATLFLPVDAGLKPLLAVDIASVLGDGQALQDLFSTAVVPGAALTLEQLQDGMRLSTLHGHKVVISVQRTSSGATSYRVGKATVLAGNIVAGAAVLHLVTPIVAPPALQDVVDVLVGFSQFSTAGLADTEVWQRQPAAEAGAVSTSTAPAGPTMLPIAATATPPVLPELSPSVDGSGQASGVSAQATVQAGSAGSVQFEAGAAAGDSDDDPVVGYSAVGYEYMHAEPGGTASPTAGSSQGWLSMLGLSQAQGAGGSAPSGTAAKNSAGLSVAASGCRLWLMVAALLLAVIL